MAGITSGPRLAGHGVRRVPVSAERLAVDPGLRDGVAGLGLGETHHLGHDSSGSQLDEDNVVETDLVERVLQSHATLNLVGADHGLEHVADLEDLAVTKVATGLVRSRNPVGHSEDSSKVIGRVTPLSGQPAVVEVEPSDHGANVEGTVHRVELVVGSNDFGAIGDDGALDDGAQDVFTLLEFQCFETAAEGVDKDPAGGVVLYKAAKVSRCQFSQSMERTASSESIGVLWT